MRDYLRERFPALAGAPLNEVRSCRYELSPDSHFIAAPHPEHPAVWLVGGGSGHGFKHGPAMAERIAAALARRDSAAGALRARRSNSRPESAHGGLRCGYLST